MFCVRNNSQINVFPSLSDLGYHSKIMCQMNALNMKIISTGKGDVTVPVGIRKNQTKQ